MNAAAASCRAATTRMPAPGSSSSSPRKLSPGTVNATLIPDAASVAAAKRPTVTVPAASSVTSGRRPGSGRSPVVLELQGDLEVEAAQASDDPLEIVLALARHSDRVALELALHLRKLVADRFLQLARE